ncbi:hypothetical protein GCM10010503_20980 [Streptomyces lucensis JCM 4490]|uniref:Uncharacterized protein n=1 Tax=Streptomyces lucensis JCM 4490 TaxID=1306176 RepID=A0A918MNM4_9ACTN|nr:hypothetical protein GCM10010503_20980 [Streptomyces lucensis JCM 4490]
MAVVVAALAHRAQAGFELGGAGGVGRRGKCRGHGSVATSVRVRVGAGAGPGAPGPARCRQASLSDPKESPSGR